MKAPGRRVITQEWIERHILEVRSQKVILDSDLATVYHVQTANLNKAVKRNLDRFPSDFMFQINTQEWERLIFQNGISKKKGRGGRRHLPLVFSEHGVAMLSSVLNSQRAVRTNILIVRAFIRLRKLMGPSGEDVLSSLEEIKRRQDHQENRIDEILSTLQAMTCEEVRLEERRRGTRYGFPGAQARGQAV